MFSEQPDGNLTNTIMKYENNKTSSFFGFSEAAMKKLRFTKDARELAKLTGKQSYVTTVSSSKLSPTH